jgi:4-hydroxy-tetrahydrodipicolinate synthase
MTAAPWTGILPSLPTPFAASGAVDAPGFRAVVRFAVDAGAHGIVCFGLAGEVSRLTVDERELLLAVAVEEADGAVPVLAGATAENLPDALRLARHAESAGAAGIVVPPPTASRFAEGDIADFMVKVANAVRLPVTIQDAPEYLGVGLSVAAVADIRRRAPNVGAVKLEAGPEGIEAWRAALGEDVAVYAGNGGMYLLDALRAGADGIMPGVDTVDLQVAIYALERDGRSAEAEALFTDLLPMLVFELQHIEHYNACAKHVLGRRGVAVFPGLRAPAPAFLSPPSIARLDAYVERLGLTCDPLSAA